MNYPEGMYPHEAPKAVGRPKGQKKYGGRQKGQKNKIKSPKSMALAHWNRQFDEDEPITQQRALQQVTDLRDWAQTIINRYEELSIAERPEHRAKINQEINTLAVKYMPKESGIRRRNSGAR